MIKTKKKSNQVPRGLNESLSSKTLGSHFDNINTHLAEKHYKKYLIVTNRQSDSQPHNRLYLCHKSMLVFMKYYANEQMISKQEKVSSYHLYTHFPNQKELIWNILTTLFEEKFNRFKLNCFCGALRIIFKIFEQKNIQIFEIQDFDNQHVIIIEKYIKNESKLNAKNLRYLGELLRFISYKINKDIHIPDFSKYVKKKQKNNIIMPTLAITWQLDHYAEQAINNLMLEFKTYQNWINELDDIGDLFSLKNLTYTFFNNIDSLGSASGKKNTFIRKLAKKLYDIEFQCWKSHFFMKEHEKNRKEELKLLGKGGINISINDERMLAMWIKTLLTNYPFEQSVNKLYSFINEEGLNSWIIFNTYFKSFKCETLTLVLNRNFDQVYQLYLLVLCRTGMNPSVIQSWKVHKEKNGLYKLGVDSGMGRIVDGYKGRGNTIQTAVLDNQLCKFIDFYTEWLTPLFDLSKDYHFFQYYSKEHNSFSYITSINLSQRKTRLRGTFFHKYPIMNQRIVFEGKLVEERVMWIDHSKLRKVNNLSEYLNQKDQYIRKMILGHKKQETEYIYQQSVEFQNVKAHQISSAQNHWIDIVKGEVDVNKNPRLKIFTTPMSNCKNPKAPTYIGVKKLKKNDVCTNWRKCLTECEQCEVIDRIHGPVILAWKNCMDDVRKEYLDLELWEREFAYDYDAAISILGSFSKEAFEYCEEKSIQYFDFVHRHVLNSKRTRRLSTEEQDAQ
jgi:hypothetical protein